MLEVGFSLYLGTGYEKNKEIIIKANQANMKYAFTSLHILEEEVDYKEEVGKLLLLTKEYNISLIVDISPNTLIKLGYTSFEELKSTSITHLRLDFGFSNDELLNLSKDFNIILNASTITVSDLEELKNKKADFSKFMACHNFYPKPYTGLSLVSLKDKNQLFKQYQIKTISFVTSDLEYRGPLFLGLPTVEEHRNNNIVYNILESHFECGSDLVLVGDVAIKDNTYDLLNNLNDQFINIKAHINKDYHFITKLIHHDRPDSSDYIFRSQESRLNNDYSLKHEPINNIASNLGSIRLSNKNYLRYNGELEIARTFIEADDRINIIGEVVEEDKQYIKFIKNSFGLKIHLVNK